MTAWMTGPWMAFDLETTGISVENDHVVTACIALLTPATPAWSREVSAHLIAVDIEIPDAAAAVHGISTEHARVNGRPPTEVLGVVATDLAQAMLTGIPVVGANLAYDFTLLDRNLRRYNLPTVDERLGRPISPVLDCMVIDRYVDQYRGGGRKLTNLCETYGIKFVGAHDATADALAAARVVYKIGLLAQKTDAELHTLYADRKVVVTRLRQLVAMSLDELHQAQISWRFDQIEGPRGLAAHFRRQGKTFDGDGHWPMRPYATHMQESMPV